MSHAGKGHRIVASRTERPISQIERGAPIALSVFYSPYGIQYCMAIGGTGERGGKAGIVTDSLLQEIERSDHRLPFVGCDIR